MLNRNFWWTDANVGAILSTLLIFCLPTSGSARIKTLIFFLALSISTSAHAVYPNSEVPFRRVMCEGELLPAVFESTESFRRELNLKATGYFATLQAARENVATRFLKEISLRPNRPSFRKITLQSLLAIHDERSYEQANRFNRSYYWQSLLDEAKREVAKDPYFAWLKKRSSIEPAGYLISHMGHDGPSAMTGDVALVKVIRDLDPRTTKLQRETADTILEMQAKEAVYLEDIAPHLRDRNHRGKFREAWNLAPDLHTARQNYHRLLSFIREKYGRTYARSEFERTSAAQKSYEIFLLENFGSAADLELYGRTLEGLKLIIDVAESSVHYVYFDQFLGELL